MQKSWHRLLTGMVMTELPLLMFDEAVISIFSKCYCAIGLIDAVLSLRLLSQQDCRYVMQN